MLKIERKKRNWIAPLVWLWLLFIVLAVLTGLAAANDITFMGNFLKDLLPANFVVDSLWGGWIALGSVCLFPLLFFFSYACIKGKSIKKKNKKGKGLVVTLGILFALLMLGGVALSGLGFANPITYSLDSLLNSAIFLGVSAVPAFVIVLLVGIVTYVVLVRVYYKKDLRAWAVARLKEMEAREGQKEDTQETVQEETKAETQIAQEPVQPEEPVEEKTPEPVEETQPVSVEQTQEEPSDKETAYWFGDEQAKSEEVEPESKEPAEAVESEPSWTKESEPVTSLEEKDSDKEPSYWFDKNEVKEAEEEPAQLSEEEPAPEEEKKEEEPVEEDTVEDFVPEADTHVEEVPVNVMTVGAAYGEFVPLPKEEILADGIYLRDSKGKIVTFAQRNNNADKYYAFAKLHDGRFELFKVTDGVEKRIPEPVENHGYTLSGSTNEYITIEHGLSNMSPTDKSVYSFINKSTTLHFTGDEEHEYEIDVTVYDNASSGIKNDRWVALSVKQ